MGIYSNELTGSHDVAITPGNSGTGGATAATAVTNAFYSTTRALVGSSSGRFEATGAVDSTLRFALDSVRNVALRFYVYMSEIDLDLARISHATDTTALTIRNSPTGYLRVLSKGSVTLWTATNPVPLNAWVRIEVFVKQGTGASTGEVTVAYYLGSSTTPIEAPTTFTGVGLGGDAGAFTNLRVGKISAPAKAALWLDSLAWRTDTDATGPIGPPVNVAPTVNAGADQNVTAGATVNLSATASDTDGSIAGYSWSYVYPASGGPTLTGATTQTPSFTAGSAGALYVLQCQVTDNGGATATDLVEVRVPLTTDFAPLPMDGVAIGAWTRAGTATTDGAALADALDTTYVESPDYSITPATEEYRLQPIVARESLQLTLRLQQTTTGGTVTVSLVEGATVRQTWTVAPGTSAGDTTLTVSNPATIVDWGNLRLRIGVMS